MQKHKELSTLEKLLRLPETVAEQCISSRIPCIKCDEYLSIGRARTDKECALCERKLIKCDPQHVHVDYCTMTIIYNDKDALLKHKARSRYGNGIWKIKSLDP